MTKQEIIKEQLFLADIKMHVLAACRLGEGKAFVRSGRVLGPKQQGPAFYCSKMVMPIDTMSQAVSKASQEMGDVS